MSDDLFRLGWLDDPKLAICSENVSAYSINRATGALLGVAGSPFPADRGAATKSIAKFGLAEGGFLKKIFIKKI